MAKEELFHHLLFGFFVRNFGSIFVRRGQVDRQALKAAYDTLSSGLALGVFPEGTRSRNHRLQEGKAGASLLAARSGALVLPVAIAGTEKIKGPISVVEKAIYNRFYWKACQHLCRRGKGQPGFGTTYTRING